MAATKNLGPEAAKQTVELTEESIQMILALKVKVLQFGENCQSVIRRIVLAPK